MGYIADLVMLLCQSCKSLKRESAPCTSCGAVEHITLQSYYMGRDTTHAAELTPELRANAQRLLRAVNGLLEAILPILQTPVKVNSGWRPAAVNAAAGGAPSSKHLSCLAVDLNDPQGEIGALLAARQELLSDRDLAIETPAYTPGWCHIQLGAPPSGNRVFQPYAGPPRKA